MKHYLCTNYLRTFFLKTYFKIVVVKPLVSQMLAYASFNSNYEIELHFIQLKNNT